MQLPYSKPSRDQDKLTAMSAAITSVHVIKNIGSSDVDATILSTLSIASDIMTPGDKAVQLVDGKLALSLAGKANLVKSSSSEQYHTGTATSGTTSTLTETGAAFPDLSNKAVQITAGTNVGKWAKIVSNTTDTLTFADDAFASAIDATSEFVVRDDLAIVFANDSNEIELAFEETSDKVITSDESDTVSTPALNYFVPVYQNAAA